MTDRRGLEQAGGDHGVLVGVAWGRPRVIDLDGNGDRLLYHWADGDKLTVTEPRMLTSFMRLGNATPEQILDFAGIWGVLEICEHGMPWRHNKGSSWTDTPAPWDDLAAFLASKDRTGCWPRAWPQLGVASPQYREWLRRLDPGNDWHWIDRFWEPLETWRQYARRAAAIVECAQLVASGKAVNPDLLMRAVESPDPTLDLLPLRVADAAGHLAESVNDWFRISGSWDVRLEWHPQGRPRVVISAEGLCAALGVQLMKVVLGSRDLSLGFLQKLAVCSACGRLYGRDGRRRPAAGRRNYCIECLAERADWRDAKRDQRAGRSKPRRRSNAPRD